VINDLPSKVKEVKCGVPQGSVLGPLLFLIYINDIDRAINQATLRLFADDTLVMVKNKNFNALIKDASCRLNEIKIWCECNKLIINSDKSCFLVFRSKRSRPYNNIQTIEIPGMSIKRASNTKYLGIIFDENLNWNTHINDLCRSLIKYFGIFNHIKNIVSRHGARQLYFAFIYSKISYGMEIMSNLSTTLFKKLQILQNKLLKLILHKDRMTPTNVLHKELHLLKVADIQKVKLLCFVNSCLNRNCPINFINYYQVREHIYNLRNEQLIIKRSRTTTGSSNNKIYGAKLWNELSNNIKRHRMQKNFKKIVISDIVSRYV
jgi:hypothetical protein